MKLTAMQAICEHNWNTELGSFGLVIHTCTRGCGLRLEASPRSILLIIEENIHIRLSARRMRMAMRDEWKKITVLARECSLPAHIQRKLQASLDVMLIESGIDKEEQSPDLSWAVARWNEEVKPRPLNNVHRRTLDDVWRQVIERMGGDPRKLCGPPHDELCQRRGL